MMPFAQKLTQFIFMTHQTTPITDPSAMPPSSEESASNEGTLDLLTHRPDISKPFDELLPNDLLNGYGCYAFQKDGILLYVGSAVCESVHAPSFGGIKSRLRTHRRSGRFIGCFLQVWYVEQRFDALSYELETIARHSPALNVKHQPIDGKKTSQNTKRRNAARSVAKKRRKEHAELLDEKGYLLVPVERVKAMAAELGVSAAAEQLSAICHKLKLPPPMKAITEAEADADFEALRGAKCYVDGTLTRMMSGNLSSDFFHQARRWQVASSKEFSPIEAWGGSRTMPRLMRTAIKAAMSTNAPIDRRLLRYSLARAFRVVSQFRPSAAKAIYDCFGPESVLDCSAGWGDRLSGFMASSALRYVGVDPNIPLHIAYARQAERYGKGKQIETIRLPIEDLDPKQWRDQFDLSFTSPPYFGVERYSNDSTQSWVRYPTYQKWVDGFLIPFIRFQVGAIRSGGHVIVNIADVFCGEDRSLVKETLEATASAGLQHVTTWQYQMAALGGGIKCEPVLVLRKP